MKKILPVGVLILIAVSVLGFLAMMGPGGGGEDHIVILTEDGFKPETLNIKKGDTVTFKTDIDKAFWPASDIHPTHGIFPEFDPQEPIDSNNSWSFKFEKSGKWSYHDHLSPYYTGTVIVSQ
jgi:plastocyanin